MANLDLPETAPTTKHYYNKSISSDIVAVYSLFSIEGDEVVRLEKAITQEENTNGTYSIQDLTQFNQRPLRDVFNHHLQTAEAKQLHPTLFVVIHTEDYDRDGVLLVDLLTDEDGRVGKVCQSASEVLLTVVGLQIGNISFDELEDFVPMGDMSGRQMPSVTYGLYGTMAGINWYDTMGLLEPGCHDDNDKWYEFGVCDMIANYNYSTDPVRDNALMHPFYCRVRTRLQKHWLICIDNLKPAEEGVLLVHVKWDGNIHRSNTKLMEIGSAAELETERCDVDKALDILAAKKEESIAKPGPTHFGAYGMNGGAALLPTLSLLGQDFDTSELANFPCLGVATYDQTNDSLKEILKWHPFHCLQQPRMHRQWFIGIDKEDPTENGVLLIHLKWDGNTERDRSELCEIGAAAEFETERCDVEKALDILEDKVDS